MDAPYFKKATAIIIVLVLLVLSFLVLKSILLSIILGFILAFVFSPLYKLLFKATKMPNFSATVITAILLIVVLLPIWFFTPIVIDQALKFYMSIHQMDFTTPLKTILPSLFASDQFSSEVAGALHAFVSKMGTSLLNSLSEFILNFPAILLQSLVVLFTFYFGLRDRTKLVAYIKSILPFSKDVEEKLFKSSKDITSSVLYGQVVLGIIQGIVIAIGFFLFGVPSALLLAVLATIAGILPIIGTMIIWLPVVIYLLIAGNAFAAIGILIFGIVSSNIDNLLRPLFVARFTKIPSAIVLIGMIGGIFFFGILGLILGPLVLAYLLIILETFRGGNGSKSFLSLLKKD